MARVRLALAFAAASLACVAPTPKPGSSAGAAAQRRDAPTGAPRVKEVCEMEKITGSNIPERVCYRVLDDTQPDHARDAAQDLLRKPQSPMKGGN